MCFHARRVARISNVRRQNRASRLVEPHVRHDSAAKKCCDTQARAVEELIGNHEIERRQIISKRTDRADGKNSLHSKHLQRADIRAVIYLARREAVTASMSRQESHAASLERAGHDGVRGIAERRLHPRSRAYR